MTGRGRWSWCGCKYLPGVGELCGQSSVMGQDGSAGGNSREELKPPRVRWLDGGLCKSLFFVF